MASLFSHAVAALSIGSCFYRPGTSKCIWAIGALCSVIPTLMSLDSDLASAYGDFLPWTPIRGSPIGVGRFFSDRGRAVLQSELVWIWVPAALLAASAWVLRRRSSAAET